MLPARDNDHSALALFAAELQAARAKAGLSRDDLAAQINYSPSLVGMVESMRRVPSLDFAQRCDESLGTAGTFTRLHAHLRMAPFPSWFRPFVQHEAEATALRWFEQSLVPGLLQTAEYAHAVLSTRIGAAQDEIEQLVEMAERPNVVVQVISREVGAHEGLTGSFVIADFAAAPSIVYLETALTGLVVERPEDVGAVILRYDTLRTEALPRAASLELLREVAKTWT